MKYWTGYLTAAIIGAISWGLLKLLGIVLSVIAFPVLFIGVLVVGVGTYLLLPLLLVGAAFGCLVKA